MWLSQARQAFVTCYRVDTTSPTVEFQFQPLAIGRMVAVSKALSPFASSTNQPRRYEMKISSDCTAATQGAYK